MILVIPVYIIAYLCVKKSKLIYEVETHKRYKTYVLVVCILLTVWILVYEFAV